MSFQRSYSKVWWGSDNQLPAMTSTASSNLTGNRNRNSGGGCFSFYSKQQQPQQQQQKQQQQQSQQQSQQHQKFNFNTGHQHQQLFQSLDSNFNFKSYSGNLSRIQEVDDEHNISKLSWEKRDSPGSLRSQDSGFSDNDESHSTRSRSRATTTNNKNNNSNDNNSNNDNNNNACSSPSTKSQSNSSRSNISIQSFGSPSSMSERDVATPPTVVRRVGKSEFYSPLVSVSRRISFSGSPASAQKMNKDKSKPKQHQDKEDEVEGKYEREGEEEREEQEEVSYLMAQLDSMHLVEEPDEKAAALKQLNSEDESPCKCSKQRRRRRVSRKSTTPLSATSKRNAVLNTDNSSSSCDEGSDKNEAKLESLSDTLSVYNNETVYLGEAPPPYNNETVILGDVVDHSGPQDETMSPLKEQRFLGSTSTPKRGDTNERPPQYEVAAILLRLDSEEYANPLLNGHTPALQSWIGDLRSSYEHEVMSTLQTKSIAAEAFKNLTITTNTVAKIIRQLQQRATHLQLDFERMERILIGEQSASLAEAFGGAQQLVADVAEFSEVLERRAVFFTESRVDRRRYEQNIEQIKLITKDTRISLEKQHYINLESLLEDLLVLKRCVVVTLRLVFEKLVRVIVQSIEQGRCDLMLRANINMIATLTNIDYDGFASLTDAFVQNEAVRALLMVCLEHRLSAVRALALRALATICCAPQAIEQLGACGGIEVLRDILQVAGGENERENDGAVRISDMERREAVSLLTQITAAWHGPEHRVAGLRDAAETIVEGLTALMTRTGCAQTLLLCAAAMNNLSRMEVTSHYSIMSNEAIFKWIETVEQRKEEASIFLYEQIASMLHNMSLNKKCHSHLANGSIIHFITSIYQAEFYRVYESRAQRDSQRRTIKAILHTLTRLVHESSLGPELLELQGIPVFLRTALVSVGATGGGDSNQSDNREQLGENVNLEGAAGNSSCSGSGGGKFKFHLSRQESYV